MPSRCSLFLYASFLIALAATSQESVCAQDQRTRIPQSETLFSSIGWTNEADAPSASTSSRPTFQIDDSPAPLPVQSAPVPSEAWTLNQVEALAIAAHPGLAEAAARVQAAQGRWLQAGLPPNPEIGYSGEELGSGEADKHGFLIQKRIVRGGKLDLDRAIECEELHWRNADWARQHQRVITDVRIAFYDVLAATSKLNLARQLSEINAQALKAAESLVRVKEGSKVDVLQAEIESETATAALHEAEFVYSGAWRQLVTLIGQPDLPARQLDGAFEIVDAPLVFDDAWSQLQAESPELLLAQIAIEKACRQLQRAHVETIPDVDVMAVLQHDAAMNGVNGNLQISFPIPTVNRNQGKIQESSAEVTAARQTLERKRLELHSALSGVFARYSTAVDQVSHYRETILPKASENLDLVRRGYEAGEFSFIQVLTVQRTFAEKNSIYLDALSRMWSSRLEIEGLLLKDSLGDAR